jgi:hypothetical protein
VLAQLERLPAGGHVRRERHHVVDQLPAHRVQRRERQRVEVQRRAATARGLGLGRRQDDEHGDESLRVDATRRA